MLKIDELYDLFKKEDYAAAQRVFDVFTREGFFENLDGPPRRPFLTVPPMIDYMIHASRGAIDRVIHKLRKKGYRLGIMKCNTCAQKLEGSDPTMHSALFYTLEDTPEPSQPCPYCGSACVWHLKIKAISS